MTSHLRARASWAEVVRRYRPSDVVSAYQSLRLAFGAPPEVAAVDVAEASTRLAASVEVENKLRATLVHAVEDADLGAQLLRLSLACGALSAFQIADLASLRDHGIPLAIFHAEGQKFAAWSRGRVGYTNRAGLYAGTASRHKQAATPAGIVSLLSAVCAPLGLTARRTSARISIGGLRNRWALQPGEGTGPHDYRPLLWQEGSG